MVVEEGEEITVLHLVVDLVLLTHNLIPALILALILTHLLLLLFLLLFQQTGQASKLWIIRKQTQPRNDFGFSLFLFVKDVVLRPAMEVILRGISAEAKGSAKQANG